MLVIDRLATSLGRRDDVPNQELARELAQRQATDEIRQLVNHLKNPDRNIQSDCIKVLYEIGYIAPELIAEYVETFLELLKSKNNRLVWGGMIALSTIAGLKAPFLFEHREELKKAIDNGSVITVDRGIKALAQIAAQNEQFQKELVPYLLHHLQTCRPKDVPLRAEAIQSAIGSENKERFIKILQARIPDLRPSQVKRLERIIKTMES